MIINDSYVMVNFLNKKRIGRDKRPKKRLVILTLLLLGIFSVLGTITGGMIGAAVYLEPKAMLLVILIGAIIGSVSQHKSEAGNKIYWYIHVLFNWDRARWRDYYPIHTMGQLLLGALVGGLVSGLVAAFCILDFNGQFRDLSWFPGKDYEFPGRLLNGALLGVSIFIFRKIILKHSTWSDWTIDDIFIYKVITKKTKKKKSSITLDLTGVLQECPTCHKKQDVKNKQCSCGEDLIKAQKYERTNYWIHYYVPGGKERKELIGHSIEFAARHAAAKIKEYGRYQPQNDKDV